MQLRALEPLLKIFYTFASKNVPGKRQMYGKSKPSVWRNLSTVNGPQNLLV